MPTAEQIRFAVEKAICEGLSATGGTWFAQYDDGEVEFSPGKEFEVTGPNGETHKFRIRLETVES